MRKMNKCLTVIGVFLVLLVGCKVPPTTPQPSPLGEKEACRPLAEIDSLMWQQPDSAFALLRHFAASPQADSLDEYNTHYFHLLLAELFYKNDCAQSNRPNVLQAVDYYDGHCGRFLSLSKDDPQSPDPSGDQVFLAARAHYINGVGYYERDSIVEACEEYLKALEVMESNFGEKELVGKKAKFMVYTYNRLGDMFEEQLFADPAIVCYKQALRFCKTTPTSIYGTPVLLYNLGIQFDVAHQRDSAAIYYEKALANMPDSNNIHYRDIITAKAVLAFNLGYCVDSVIKDLKHVISLTSDDSERTRRILNLGNIMFHSNMYDSSQLYLETVFEQEEDIQSRILAAENLCSICREKRDSIKAKKYTSFLAAFTMSEIEKKKEVSKINEMFYDYWARKQEKRAEETRKEAIKRVTRINIPIAVVLGLAIMVMAKLRSRKLMEEQQEEADRILGEAEQEHEKELRLWQAEADKELENKEKQHQEEMEEREKRHAEAIEIERQTHRMEQAALSGRLKRSNQEVRELKDQIKQKEELSANTETAASFIEEPICRLIMERVKEGRFKSKIDCEFYKSYALDKQQLLDLRVAADRHYNQFTLRLRKTYPKLTNTDIDYCCLYLLNLTYSDVSALMQRAYHTVVERDSKIKKTIGSENPLSVVLMDIAQSDSSI